MTSPWIEAIHPDDRAMVLATLRGASRARSSPASSSPFRVVHDDGSEVWVRSSSTLLRDEAGEVTGYVGFVLDVTAIRLREQAQRASEERYRRIVETATEGIWAIDAAGRTTFTNQRMAAMLGWTSEEMLGRPLDDFMDDEGRAITASNLERRKRGIAEEHDFKFTHRSGAAVWTMLSTTPLHDERGAYAGALGMVTDVSLRRQAEAKIRELNEDLQRRNVQLELANRELESFSYSVSHDLRAPLRTIDGFSLAVLNEHGDALDAKAKGYLARVRRATQTMGQLIDDLLLLARVTRSEIREGASTSAPWPKRPRRGCARRTRRARSRWWWRRASWRGATGRCCARCSTTSSTTPGSTRASGPARAWRSARATRAASGSSSCATTAPAST